MTNARTLDLQLHLLDHQVVDSEGGFLCNVDDLELELDEQGRPIVVAILVGARALGPRLRGRLGRWVVDIATRISRDRTRDPLRIDFRHVTDIGSVVKVNRSADELDVTPLEMWVERHVISRVPGSGHASK